MSQGFLRNIFLRHRGMFLGIISLFARGALAFERGALAFVLKDIGNTSRFVFPDDPWILAHAGNDSQKHFPVTLHRNVSRGHSAGSISDGTFPGSTSEKCYWEMFLGMIPCVGKDPCITRKRKTECVFRCPAEESEMSVEQPPRDHFWLIFWRKCF